MSLYVLCYILYMSEQAIHVRKKIDDIHHIYEDKIKYFIADIGRNVCKITGNQRYDFSNPPKGVV